mmetsp:Transcript_7435/g.21647  ORF Transcript_7435/g.21647 Transcript_7435/m.21647 type:complete len:330 (+) Transcript_7435:2496-3485(+)
MLWPHRVPLLRERLQRLHHGVGAGPRRQRLRHRPVVRHGRERRHKGHRHQGPRDDEVLRRVQHRRRVLQGRQGLPRRQDVERAGWLGPRQRLLLLRALVLLAAGCHHGGRVPVRRPLHHPRARRHPHALAARRRVDARRDDHPAHRALRDGHYRQGGLDARRHRVRRLQPRGGPQLRLRGAPLARLRARRLPAERAQLLLAAGRPGPARRSPEARHARHHRARRDRAHGRPHDAHHGLLAPPGAGLLLSAVWPLPQLPHGPQRRLLVHAAHAATRHAGLAGRAVHAGEPVHASDPRRQHDRALVAEIHRQDRRRLHVCVVPQRFSSVAA